MADVHIDTYDRKYLEGMTALYNAETAYEPHVAPLNPERFLCLVEQKSSFDPSGLFVALKGSEVVGWLHACVAAGSEGRHDPENRVARIRMLIFPADRLKVGNALVAEATAWLKQSGQNEIEALHARSGYPFYRGLWFGGEPMGPTSMPHVQITLEVGGYKNTQESIFMTAEMTALPPEIQPDVPVEFVEAAAQMKHEAMRESWIGFEPRVTRALLNGEDVGSISWVIEPYVADRLGAPAMNIWGLGVREEHRRKGIAAALISRALRYSYTQGARFASVSTQVWNAPAHATYASTGFRPHCIVVGRLLRLDEKESAS
jgi:GNAT superfamily N-acetyltransferase